VYQKGVTNIVKENEFTSSVTEILIEIQEKQGRTTHKGLLRRYNSQQVLALLAC